MTHSRSYVLSVVLGVGVAASSLQAQAAGGRDVVAALKQGGCVLVMRHASSPATLPTKATAAPDNTHLERQLDAQGQAGAAAMGAALRRLGIRVTTVWTSPTYRARETARLAGFERVRTDEHLGDSGRSMQAASDAQAVWLRARVAERPAAGNVLIVTHQPNLAKAFPDIREVTDGECLVFRPDGHGGAALVGRVKIDEWPHLGP